METCYKIHGYPPGFKQRQKVPAGNSNAAANQVSDQLGVQEKDNIDSSGQGDVFQNLNTSQYQQLVKLLTAQISSAGNDQTAPDVMA